MTDHGWSTRLAALSALSSIQARRSARAVPIHWKRWRSWKMPCRPICFLSARDMLVLIEAFCLLN